MPGGAHLTRRTRSSRSSRREVAVGTCLFAVGALTACSGSVDVPPPVIGPEISTACAPLMAAMPAVVGGQQRRSTHPDSALTRAWGDPAITVVCGVAAPSDLQKAGAECFQVNGVGWYAQPSSAGVRFTSIGRRLYVQAWVPHEYAPEADPLVDLAAPMRAHDTLVSPCL